MIPQEVMQKIRHIQIRTSHMVNDILAGQYHSVFKGQGMEFQEVREYVPGDDIRMIDWNVTARTSVPHVKLLVEERELTVMLLVDASGSGRFGSVARFKNELAAVSWNFLLFLVAGSGCLDTFEQDNNPECFDPQTPFSLIKCSWNKAQFCGAVQGFLGLAGVQRNVLRAGGDGTFGRRTLLWHSGQELVLTYNKRNVFGMSADFAEDTSKTNWGVEFTWFESVPFFDNNEFDNIHHVDTFNLTVSVDRPTFINFLNANRTFFFNSQWFFQYIAGHRSGMPSNGPFNALFTFAMFTGYFQDRLNPSLVTIYDFNSRSGGVLPSIGYRFTEAFSVSMGMAIFFGRTELNDMPINPFGPASNRAGPNAYKDGGETFISNIRKRDEVWLRIRMTF